MNNICGPIPPTSPSPGDLWYNTSDNEFYVFDDARRWITVDNDDLVTNIIMHDDVADDPYKAYERAMGVL